MWQRISGNIQANVMVVEALSMSESSPNLRHLDFPRHLILCVVYRAVISRRRSPLPYGKGYAIPRD